MRWALVIHQASDYGVLLASSLMPVLSCEVVHVPTIAGARSAMMKHGSAACCLIVASATAPLDEYEPQQLDRSRPTLTAFLREVRGADGKPPCIALLTMNDGDRGEALRAAGNVELLQIDVTVLLRLQELARNIVDGKVKDSVSLPHDVDVDITLAGEGGHWVIRGSVSNPVDQQGTIAMNVVDLKRLMTDSRDAHQANCGKISQLGQDMYLQLVAHPLNSGLELALAKCTRPPGSLDAVRFRFHVDNVSSQMLVETLAKPTSQQADAELDFWMRRTPIVRKFGNGGKGHPLFKDRRSRSEKVRCLILQGDALGFNAGGALAQAFHPIPGAVKEVAWLRAFLSKDLDGFNLDEVKVLSPSGAADENYGALVRKELSEGSWKLIHYVGHSAIGADGRGYLALGGGRDDLIGIDDFAMRVKNAQFVFLNSCMSANARFIMQMIEKDIPAVAGYAWNIDDGVAHAFSRKFYENLFAGTVSKRFLEYAFMRARIHLHDTYKEKTVWTSPQLFMQTAVAEHDPGYTAH